MNTQNTHSYLLIIAIWLNDMNSCFYLIFIIATQKCIFLTGVNGKLLISKLIASISNDILLCKTLNESTAICRNYSLLGRFESVGLNLRYETIIKANCHRQECTKNMKQFEGITIEVMFRSVVNKFECSKAFAQIHHGK